MSNVNIQMLHMLIEHLWLLTGGRWSVILNQKQQDEHHVLD